MKSILKDYKDYFKEISPNVVNYLGIILFATLVSSAYNVLFGIYMLNIGYDETVVGTILSLKTLGIALGALPVAIFSQRLNKKRTIIIGLLLMTLSSLIILNVRQLIVMEAFALLFGLGNATVMILQAPIIYENTKPEHRVMAFSMAFVFQNISFVFGSFVLGYISQALSSVNGAAFGNWAVLNGSTLLIGVSVFIALRFSGTQMEQTTREESIAQSMRTVLQGYLALLKGKTFYYLLQVALVGLGAGMIVPFFSMYLKYMLNITDGVVGTIMAISQVGTVFGGLIVPPLAKRVGRVNTVIACQLLSIPFLLSISFPQGIFIITMSFFFRSSLMNMASPIIGSLAMEITTDETRTYMSSMISLINNLFRAIGIFFGGILMFKYSYNAPYYWTIAFYLVGTLIIYKVFKDTKKEEAFHE